MPTTTAGVSARLGGVTGSMPVWRAPTSDRSQRGCRSTNALGRSCSTARYDVVVRAWSDAFCARPEPRARSRRTGVGSPRAHAASLGRALWCHHRTDAGTHLIAHALALCLRGRASCVPQPFFLTSRGVREARALCAQGVEGSRFSRLARNGVEVLVSSGTGRSGSSARRAYAAAARCTRSKPDEMNPPGYSRSSGLRPGRLGSAPRRCRRVGRPRAGYDRRALLPARDRGRRAPSRRARGQRSRRRARLVFEHGIVPRSPRHAHASPASGRSAARDAAPLISSAAVRAERDGGRDRVDTG